MTRGKTVIQAGALQCFTICLAFCLVFQYFSLTYAADDKNKGAAVFIVERRHRDWYVLLLKDRYTSEWGLPGGYSHVNEHRNITAERETFEESNGGINVKASQLNFGQGQPFKNYVEITKGRGKNQHRNITFFVRMHPLKRGELRAIAERMQQAPRSDGYRETDGVAMVKLDELISAVKNASYASPAFVWTKRGWTFDYNKGGKALYEMKKGVKLRVNLVFMRSMKSYMTQFDEKIKAAKKGPVLAYLHGHKNQKTRKKHIKNKRHNNGGGVT
ncbi:hypothetical protein DdX_13602 [Ditylenchus destructor]|uniref:Nudix hydrolase domain-containing protein n=1 Tax=Ditylenchus destructor TaxID=166010 RepID=A0AAD4QWD8_9BILA|nr:hypothetical protein DdX_13602 [Ditylenchus destructor]